MGFSISQPSETAEIYGKSFTFDPLSEFDRILELEESHAGDTYRRDVAYLPRLEQLAGLSKLPMTAVSAFVEMVIDYRDAFLAANKKKPTAVVESGSSIPASMPPDCPMPS